MCRLGTLTVFAAILNKVLEKKKPAPQLSKVGFSEAKLVHGGIAGQAHREAKWAQIFSWALWVGKGERKAAWFPAMQFQHIEPWAGEVISFADIFL